MFQYIKSIESQNTIPYKYLGDCKSLMHRVEVSIENIQKERQLLWHFSDLSSIYPPIHSQPLLSYLLFSKVWARNSACFANSTRSSARRKEVLIPVTINSSSVELKICKLPSPESTGKIDDDFSWRVRFLSIIWEKKFLKSKFEVEGKIKSYN